MNLVTIVQVLWLVYIYCGNRLFS